MDILWWWKCGRLDLRLGVGEGATYEKSNARSVLNTKT